ncbi:MAG: NTP transferase domain-containing protein, partial [Alphaproteobacteria bacterium]|nr:NTP transferase domain-containing protein [Alphaproteobacteria bacterium]
MNSVIVIPSRLASTRLPNKPLADIAGLPMIVHCLHRAEEADIGPVIVAAGDQDIYDVIHDHGGKAILTDPDLPSGSDRVWQALSKFDPDETYSHIINVQGDL